LPDGKRITGATLATGSTGDISNLNAYTIGQEVETLNRIAAEDKEAKKNDPEVAKQATAFKELYDKAGGANGATRKPSELTELNTRINALTYLVNNQAKYGFNQETVDYFKLRINGSQKRKNEIS
jgi:hypothetical protein